MKNLILKSNNEDFHFRKMFIGGLSWQTTPGKLNPRNSKLFLCWFCLENLKTYFTQFGEILECMIMKDAITKRSRWMNQSGVFFILIFYFRGFGFITFKEANAVDKVLAKDVHSLDDKQVWFIHLFGLLNLLISNVVKVSEDWMITIYLYKPMNRWKI